MNQSNPLPMVLTAYALPHVMGYLATQSGERHPQPLGLVGLMDAAVELGLSGIETPLPKPEQMPLEALRDALQTRGLRFIPDGPQILEGDVEQFRAVLHAAATLGSGVVRSMLSSLLCGDRRRLEGGWSAHLERIAERLRQVLPIAEELGLAVALENHQDADSDDLLRLHEMAGHSPAYGITLDAGNPLAVGEGPVEFAARVAPLVRHAHLKDYTIHFAREGYRLVRCPAGQGVVDFPAVLRLLRANGHEMWPGVEVGAQATRTIPLLEEDWWGCYPPCPGTRLLPALRILWQQGRPVGEHYSSAWERGEDSATVAEEEWRVLRESVEYFRQCTE